MVYSNTETNFRRLLNKTEEIAEKQDPKNWRFEKYLLSLEDFLNELNKATVSKPSLDTLKDYAKRVEFLKKIYQLNKSFLSNNQHEELPKDSVKVIPNPGPINCKRDIKPKQIYQKSKLNQEKLLRQQLLGETNDIVNGTAAKTNDINKLLAEHQENQEKIANEMIKTVRSIKDNSLIARRIIQSDNKVLEKLNSAADKNVDNLKTVNDHLSERVSRSCNCWIWIMLFLVMIVFIMMVLFMKLFPKKRYSYHAPSTTTPISHHSGDTYTHFLQNKTLLVDNQTIHTLEL